MKTIIFLLTIINVNAFAQERSSGSFSNIPLIVSLNFNSISTPFHNLKNNFRNVGIRIGTEIPLNKRQNLLQSLNICYYRNKINGDGIFLNSEFTYRPDIYKGFLMEFKIGPGISQMFFPAETLVSKNGKWEKQKGASKTSFQVHTGVGLGYSSIKIGSTQVSPFINYELVAIPGYNRSIPVLPTTFIQTGTRLKF